MLKGLLIMLIAGIALVVLALLGMALLVAVIGAAGRAMMTPFKRK